MLRKLIIFLIRRRLKLKKFQAFQFENQLSKDTYYWFSDTTLRKYHNGALCDSGVSLNWLLSNECKIIRHDDFMSVLVTTGQFEQIRLHE